MRSATSVGANYRACCCARSRADFIAKLEIVEEECDESLYWLESLVADDQIQAAACAELAAEGNQILAMIVASIKTARSARKTPNSTDSPKFVNRQSQLTIPTRSCG